MIGHHKKFLIYAILVFLALFWPGTSYAYIGPAIAFVGYLLGPVAAVFAVVGIILYLPIKALIKKVKKAKDKPEDKTSDIKD